MTIMELHNMMEKMGMQREISFFRILVTPHPYRFLKGNTCCLGSLDGHQGSVTTVHIKDLGIWVADNHDKWQLGYTYICCQILVRGDRFNEAFVVNISNG